jgi:hypothetical protein
MMKGKSWDKGLLLALGLAVIAGAVLFSLKAQGFTDLFVLGRSSPNNEVPETQKGRADIAKSLVEKNQSWKNSDKGVSGTEVPLFVSIPLVEKDSQVINMIDPNSPPLRPPVPNSWLMEHNLDFLNAGVLGQDPDADGFSTLAEFEAKTGPMDPKSRPSYASKLIFASRQQELYILKFAAESDPGNFRVERIPTSKWPQSDGWYVRVGEPSEDGQFRVDGFEKKRAKNKSGIEVDASVLKITYLPKGEPYELVRGADTQIPTYFAEMKFELDPQFQQYVKEGDSFNLVTDPDTKYRVVKVNEASVVITFQTGTEPEQTVEIPKK